MRRIALIAAFFVVSISFDVQAESPSSTSPSPVVLDPAVWHLRPVRATGYSYQPLGYNEVHPGGLLAERMQGCMTRLLRDRNVLCVDEGWGADRWGRWIGGMSALAAVYGAPIEPEIDEIWRSLRETQNRKGLFLGDDPMGERYRQVWFGQARGIWGLQEYYHVFRKDESLKSLLQAADVTVA